MYHISSKNTRCCNIFLKGTNVFQPSISGVTSFSIDLESKRVTVMGHISPVAVLESISKVKRAELWTAC